VTLTEASFFIDEQLIDHGCTRRDIEQISFSVKENGICLIYCYLRNGDAVAAGFNLHGYPLDEERALHALSDVGRIH
jgi:hypothetical protein